MSVVVPTTAGVSDLIVSQIEGSISQTVPILPKAFIRVLAKVLSGIVVLLYKYAGFSLLQMFVAHASARPTVVNGKTIIPLVEWGRLIGVGDPNAATRAELLVEVTVTNQEGNLDSSAALVRTETQVIYNTLALTALDAPTKQVTIRAVSDQDGNGGVGAIGNLVAGDIVSFANPLPNVARDAVVVSQSVTGADAEDMEAYRARVIRRFQRRPQGGAYADYQAWGEDVEGIANVYPYTSPAPGEVDVYVEATEESSGSADGIPTVAQLQAVFDAIQLEESGKATRRPASAGVNVLPITREPIDVFITGLDVDDEETVKESIEEGLDEYLRSREPFIVGLSVLPRQDRITRAGVSGIVDDIVNAAGGAVASVALSLDEALINAFTLEPGQKAKLGVITYED